jgi:hypothetical protein
MGESSAASAGVDAVALPLAQVLTPLQDALFLVECYPMPPDPLLISKLVAEELQDASADHVLSADALLGPSAPPGLFTSLAGGHTQPATLCSPVSPKAPSGPRPEHHVSGLAVSARFWALVFRVLNDMLLGCG